MGIGEKILPHYFPKYYFLLVKPNYNNSTKEMYQKLKFKKNSIQENLFLDKIVNKDENIGNDFEKIILKNNTDSKKIFNFLKNIDNTIFSRMTGTGSCFYSVFYKKQDAFNAKKIFKSKFTDLWTFVGENNLKNNNLM
jgi:4-diphosphocytidyl-2C-methyl-D-erythritol kinase